MEKHRTKKTAYGVGSSSGLNGPTANDHDDGEVCLKEEYTKMLLYFYLFFRIFYICFTKKSTNIQNSAVSFKWIRMYKKCHELFITFSCCKAWWRFCDAVARSLYMVKSFSNLLAYLDIS